MYQMTLIRFNELVKNERTGKYEVRERIEVAGTNMLMKFAYKSVSYEIVREFK